MNYEPKFEGVKQFRKHKKLFLLKKSTVWKSKNNSPFFLLTAKLVNFKIKIFYYLRKLF